jgi:2-deoxy-D-gluconate 3-dehydrogenase
MKVQDLFSVEGKVALVSGGSRGIGEMIAAGYLANSARVYITSRTADACDAAAERLIENYGGECISIPGDVSVLTGIESIVAEVAKREDKLHILVNNAGTFWSDPIDEFPEEGWDKVMNTNAKATFFMMQKFLPLLRAAGTAEDPARVINIGSVDGLKNTRFENHSYGPSKAAIHHMTRQMSTKLVKDHVILNAIAPGPFPTSMLATGIGKGGDADGVDWERVGKNNPRGRVGTAEDIAGLALYLSSRAGAFTVGETITCDGGAVARTV